MRKYLTVILALYAVLIWVEQAAAQQTRILWWDGSPPYSGATNARDREAMANYIAAFDGGGSYAATFKHSTRKNTLAPALAEAAYDIIVLDVTTTSANFSNQDLDALRAHYQRGKRALILDGTLWVRNSRNTRATTFPGPNGAGAALLMNQIKALADAGGGVLIGTDHREFQAGANQLLRALIPSAQFSGQTNPSRDGDFLGSVLLNTAVPVKPLDILRHWEAIPSQAEAPVGQFTDFTGAPVTLYALVETSDKPGGRAKRPYISASFPPGDGRTAIDSNSDPEPVKNTMPTRKSRTD
ncbi:MAG: hypothetical protein AB8B47_05460 [Roseobacter sp.]